MPTHLPTGQTEIATLINQLISSRQITMGQYQQLSEVVMADGTVDDQERRQLNRLFDAIQTGTVKFIG